MTLEKKTMKPQLSFPVDTLAGILKDPRPSQSVNQTRSRDKLKALFDGKTDGYGNLYVTVGNNAPTLFTAHLDTVGTRLKPKRLGYNYSTGIVRVLEGDTLGADDGTGVWIMMNMIRSKVPGTYAFFLDEECGGIGSSFAAEDPDSLIDFTQFDYCVSFDRMGTESIITHQGGERSASDGFAEALGKEFAAFDSTLNLIPDDSGSFTDSKNFTHLIPECTNISVGYYNQHSSRETQDMHFAELIARACCAIQWDQLPVIRDPSVVEDLFGFNPWGNWAPSMNTLRPSSLSEAIKNNSGAVALLLFDLCGSLENALDEIMEYTQHKFGSPTEYSLQDLLEDQPYALAEALVANGFIPEDLDIIPGNDDPDEDVIAAFFLDYPVTAVRILEQNGLDVDYMLNLMEPLH